MTQPFPFAPDIQATKKAAAAPIADFLAYTRDELIREFPHLRTKDGTNRLLMGTYMDPALDPESVLKLAAELTSDVSGLQRYERQISEQRGLFTRNVYSDKLAFKSTIGHPDHGVQIVATAPDLCISCEKPHRDGQCKPSHPDTARWEELNRFYIVNHEVGHVLGNMAGFEAKSIEPAMSLSNQLQTQGASQAAALENATLWRSHILENSAEAFGILRTVQIYGDEGYHFMRAGEIQAVVAPAHPEGGGRAAPYYPPQARADLLEWARAHQDELRTMSQGDLFHLALDKTPHLTPDQYLDLRNRASTDSASLSPTAALRRWRYDETEGSMPYLNDHDARIVTAEKDYWAAKNATADLNPYRPFSAKGTGIPAEGFSETATRINTDMLRFGKDRDPDCATPPQTKPQTRGSKPSGP